MRKVFLDDLPRSKTGKSIIWDKCIGEFIEFDYDGICGKLKITNYKTDGKHPYVEIKYNNNYKWIKTQVLQLCCIGGLIGANKVVGDNRPWKYKFDIDEITEDRVITDRKVEFVGKYHIKYYKYKCLKCNFDCGENYYNGILYNDVWFEENTIRSGGCSCCGGIRVVKGINSIFDTDPELVNYFLDKKDGFKYSRGVHKEIQTKCPTCGNVEKKRIYELVNKGFSCRLCGDGFSYPNKFMYNLLSQLDIKFTSEYRPKWLKGRRYDFYIPSLKIIIEMDGGLGHGKRVIGKITPEQSIIIDNWKDEQAEKYELLVIRINCDKSDMDYIRNNILLSRLTKYFDLSKINWKDCDTYAKGSLYIDIVNYYSETNDKTINIANKFGVSQSTVIRYLKCANKNKLVYFNPKENMMKSQFRKSHIS